jgi:hypothetical protein
MTRTRLPRRNVQDELPINRPRVRLISSTPRSVHFRDRDTGRLLRRDRDEDGAVADVEPRRCRAGGAYQRAPLAHRPRISLRPGWPTLPKSMNGDQLGELIRPDPKGVAMRASRRIYSQAAYWNIPDQLKSGEYAMLPAGLIRKTIADSWFVSPTTRSLPDVPASTL